MEEKCLLIEIIRIILEDGDLNMVKKLARELRDIRKEYPEIDWIFLEEIDLKTSKQIESWLNLVLDTVYI